jgi:hypothetical protein
VRELSNDMLELRGTPDEIYGAENSMGFVDVMAGFTVTKVTAGGQHDGHSAHVITLADDMGDREIGRLVVRDDVGYREECLEWFRQFDSPDGLREYVREYHAAAEKPVITATVDYAYDGDGDTLEVAVAKVAAEFGVSINVLEERGPGGGWPEIAITGLRANVLRVLKDAKKGWGMSDEAVLMALGEDD